MSELFANTFEIMLAGMGGVFIFLVMLTIAVSLLTKFFPEAIAAKPDATSVSSTAKAESADTTSSATKLAAVTVAVQKYRQARGSAADQQE